jgi:hypothetical protein
VCSSGADNQDDLIYSDNLPDDNRAEPFLENPLVGLRRHPLVGKNKIRSRDWQNFPLMREAAPGARLDITGSAS